MRLLTSNFFKYLLKVPRREVHRIYDKIYATIYGHCIGDALGLLTEGLNKDDVKKVCFILCDQTIGQ